MIFSHFYPTTSLKQSIAKNISTIKALRRIGWEMPEIRRALVKLNNINVRAAIKGHRISTATFYQTINGQLYSPIAISILSDELGTGPEYLFPDIKRKIPLNLSLTGRKSKVKA